MSASTKGQCSPKKPARSAPAWVGVAVLVGCAAGAVLFGWWLLFGSLPQEHAVTLDPTPARVRRAPVSAVHSQGTDRWVLRSNGAGMWIRKEKGEYRFRPFYAVRILITRPDDAYLAAQMKLRRDPSLARQMGLTADQVKKLRSLELSAMQVNNSEMLKVEGLWLKYVEQPAGAGRQQAERELMQEFDKMAKTSLLASKRAAFEGVAQLRQIITPEILTRLSAANSPGARAAK